MLGIILSLGMVMGCDNREKEEQEEEQEVVDNTLINGSWINSGSNPTPGTVKYVFNDPNYEYYQTVTSAFDSKSAGTYEATNKGKLTLFQTTRTLNGVPSGTQVRTWDRTFTIINENKITITQGVQTSEYTRQE